tara:strand:- start:492 stop:1208 length:717 start_codon:yes stop_codon:yes gene_type:complete
MTFEILTEVSAKYYNIDKTESVEIIIPSVVNNGRKVKTLGIWCSGGADSSALLYLLCKEVIRNNLDVKIQPMSVRRQRPWNPIKATYVINKITEILNFRNMLPHLIYYPNLKDVNQTEWKEFQDRNKQNEDAGVWDVLYDGITSNPPEGEMPYDTDQKNRRDPKVNHELVTSDGSSHRPFFNTDKKFIADIYIQENLMSNLFPLTWSCEGTFEQTNGYLTPCENCWWCHERYWAFNRY